MKTLRMAAVAVLATTLSFCSAGSPAYAKSAPAKPVPAQTPPRLTAVEIAKLLPPPPPPREPSMYYGPWDRRTASIA